jgi:hypothetical protein
LTDLRESLRPELVELLEDAERAQADVLAMAMAFHPRLGAESPLRVFGGANGELLRTMLLPLCDRQNVREARERRLKEWAATEGLTIDDTLRHEYAEEGAPFVAARFRFAHFMRQVTEPQVRRMADFGARHRLKARLDWRGILFCEPYTREYEARATKAALHRHPSEA